MSIFLMLPFLANKGLYIVLYHNKNVLFLMRLKISFAELYSGVNPNLFEGEDEILHRNFTNKH